MDPLTPEQAYAMELVAHAAESVAEDDLNEDGELSDTEHDAACDLAIRVAHFIGRHPAEVLQLATLSFLALTDDQVSDD